MGIRTEISAPTLAEVTELWGLIKATCSFWSRVIRKGKDECWIWQGATYGKASPYGKQWCNGRGMKAHRFSWLVHFGPIPDGLLVCHKCDNPRCVNPNHLFLGTHKDNSEDSAKKGRNHRERGTARYCAKLTDEKVAIILSRYNGRRYGGDRLARDFGVSRTAIYNIIYGLRWKHVPRPQKQSI